MNEDKVLPQKEHQKQYAHIFGRVLKLAVVLLSADKPKIGKPLLEFPSFWLQALKKFDLAHDLLSDLLQTLIYRVRYPEWCTHDEFGMSEYEEEYAAYRDELANLFINLASVKSFHPALIKTLAQLFESISPLTTPFNEAEVPLFLAYHLQQAIPSNMRETADNVYAELMQYIFKIDFLQYNHKIVIVMLLEDIVRYSSYFINDPKFVIYITQLFFGPKGIFNKEPQIAKKSCYLFLRLCEKL